MITIVITARASYAKLYTVIEALAAGSIPVDLVCYGSAVLTRYGDVARQIKEDFPQLQVTRLYTTLEGATGPTSAKDTGVALMTLADHVDQTKPALVVVCADRYETLAATIAATYQNIPVAHLQGGERSGNIDDRVRNANTVLATYHFPATERAYARVRGLTTNPLTHLILTGCPSIDLARRAMADPPVTVAQIGGHGAPLNLQDPFVTVLQHSETETPAEAFTQMWETLEGVRGSDWPALVFWPGNDLGMEGASKAIRIFVDRYPQYPVRTIRSLPPQRFLRLLTQTACLVGNSSAGIREAGYLQTPVINIGTRQRGRECSLFVHHVPHFTRGAITVALQIQRSEPRPSPSLLYGDGTAGARIAQKLIEWTRSS